MHPNMTLWQRLIRRSGVAWALCTLPQFNFVLNRPPLRGFVLLVFISPLNFLIFNGAVRSEWLPFSYQWYSALIGDVFIAAMDAWCLWALQGLRPLVMPVFHRLRSHLIVVAVWLGVGLEHVWQERNVVTTWERRAGLNSLYHTFFVYPILGYVTTVLVIAAYKHVRPMRPVQYWLAVGGGSLAYLATVAYDMTHQYAPNGVLKNVYTSPEDGWRNIRILLSWLWTHVS